MVSNTERFGLVLSSIEKLALECLAQDERLSRAAVMRRLIRAEAERRGLWPTREKLAESSACVEGADCDH